MKIELISEHASPLAALGGADAGGQNVHVAALATELGRRGHEVTVCTRRDAADLPDQVPLAPGVTVEHVPAGPPRPVPKDELPGHMTAFARWLEQRWAIQRPDLVHAHFWMSGAAAIRAARRHRVPVVLTYHALGLVKRRHQGLADTSPPERIGVEAALARRVSAIIATCTDEVAELAAYDARADRVYVVPCGVDVAHFHPGGPGQPAGPDGRPGCVVTLGRLVPRKGVDTMIAALAGVPDAELVVAGGPPQAQLDDEPEVWRLRKVAAETGVASRVTFTGRVAHEDVPALLRSADVIVSVPSYEPFGIVPLEAMACGVPIVASAVGGHLDTVADGVTGLLTPPGDPQALAQRLRVLLDHPARRRGLGAAGVARVRTRYTWAQVAAETEAVYTAVRSARPAATVGQLGGQPW
ncbi:MAG TPA: glycosyltransferase [Streptosporangiaceae bacterium]|nr:glycosyltransferase [Streptosporangiaceae bacterium]